VPVTIDDGVTLSLEERVARHETVQAAHNAIAEYAFAIDHKDRQRLSDVFADDAVVHTSRRDYAGRAEILGFYDERSMDPSTPTIRHFVTNMHVEVTGTNQATARAYFLYVTGKDLASIIGWGLYTFKIARGGGPSAVVELTIKVEVQTESTRGWAEKLMVRPS
jgi:ketosteroid isomerase-like protein